MNKQIRFEDTSRKSVNAAKTPLRWHQELPKALQDVIEAATLPSVPSNFARWRPPAADAAQPPERLSLAGFRYPLTASIFLHRLAQALENVDELLEENEKLFCLRVIQAGVLSLPNRADASPTAPPTAIAAAAAPTLLEAQTREQPQH